MPSAVGSTLCDLLVYLESRLSLTLILRKADSRSDHILRKLNKTTIKYDSIVHAKFFLSERLALFTSANLLYSSLYVNHEHVQLCGHSFGSANQAFKSLAQR